MQEAGFEGVMARRFRLPLGPWPKDQHLVGVFFCARALCASFFFVSFWDIWGEGCRKLLTFSGVWQKTVGSWNLIQVEEGLEGFTLRLFTQVLKWDPKEVQVLLANVRKNLRDPKIHAQYD